MRFRTKPFEIEAVQFDGSNFDELQNFVGVIPEHDGMTPGFDKTQSSLEVWGEGTGIVAKIWDYLHQTWVGVKANQWIIRGQKGEYYPCDPDIFSAKYEAVDE